MKKPAKKVELEAAIKQVYSDICQAFAELDFDTVLEYFADEGMVKISQGRLLRGKRELAQSWRQRLAGVAELRIRMENVRVQEVDGHHAWSTADEYISVNGEERQAIVSNIFVLQESGWKILLDHTTYVEQET